MSETATSSGILLNTITTIERYLDKYDSFENSEPVSDKSNFYIQIKSYIDNNYSDPMLCLGELSTKFKINSSYLSSQFKKEFKIGVTDYITSVRIEAAKKLLATTDESNEKISQRVGYLNIRTFLRVFSKYEKVTPKEYRRLKNPSVYFL